MMIRTTILGMCALALAVPAAAAAQPQQPPAGGEPKDFRLPEPETVALENGMRVTLVPYGVLPKVTATLVVRVGNIDEAPHEVWLADLTGDLMEEGTTTRTAEEVAQAAASMGGGLNVGVGMDQTTVSLDVLTEFGPDAIRLIADVMRNPRLPASEIDRLKTDRVRQLNIAQQQPQQMALARFRQALYGDHPYGRLFPTEEMLRGYTIEQVRRFHRDQFGGARAHLYVVGRFDAGAMKAAARQAFADWKPGTPPATNVPTPQTARKVHLIDRPGASQSTVYLGLPVIDPSHDDFVPLFVTNALLGGSFASRITSNIREEKGYTYSPFSQISTRYRDAYWVEVADVTTAVTGASLQEIFGEIDQLQAESPSGAELEGIQNYVAGTFVLQNSSRGGIIGQLAFLDLHGLTQSYLTTFVRNVYAVTPEDVRRITTSYLDDDRMTIVVAGDREQIADQIRAFGEIVEPTLP